MIKVYPNLRTVNTNLNFRAGETTLHEIIANKYVDENGMDLMNDNFTNGGGTRPPVNNGEEQHQKPVEIDNSKTIREKVARRYAQGIQVIEEDSKTLRNDAFSKRSRKAVLKGTGTKLDKEICQEKKAKLDNKVKELKLISDDFKNNANAPKDVVPKPIQKLFKNWAKVVSKFAKNPDKLAKGVAVALAAGNVGKEMVGTAVYTVQALTNEDLPADKRKFIGMYDLMVGLVSTTFSALFGFGAVAVQDKLITKGLKKSNGAGFPKYAAAYAGLVWLIPQFLQTIIGKRIVAPAIATPLAGKIKENMIAKAEAQKALQNPQIVDNADTVELSTKAEAEPELNFTNSGFVDLKSYVAQIKEQPVA